MPTASLVGFGIREPHTPNQIAEALVRTQYVESGIDIQKRPESSSFFIVAVERFQGFLCVSQPCINLRSIELADIAHEFLVRLQKLPPESAGSLGRQSLSEGNFVRCGSFDRAIVA